MDEEGLEELEELERQQLRMRASFSRKGFRSNSHRCSPFFSIQHLKNRETMNNAGLAGLALALPNDYVAAQHTPIVLT